MISAKTCATRLILLPGMGVDERLFLPQRAEFPGLEVPIWLPPQPRESLSDYAARMARGIRVRPDEPFYIGGASFGGMIALEMARWLRPKAVFLIASCRSGRQLAGHVRWLERMGRLAPDALVRASQWTMRLVFPDIQRLPPERRALFFDMVASSPVSFLRWSARAILDWDPSADPPAPIYHIHGQEDRVIPLRNVNPDRVVQGVGHLVNMNRPDEVNRFLREKMDG